MKNFILIVIAIIVIFVGNTLISSLHTTQGSVSRKTTVHTSPNIQTSKDSTNITRMKKEYEAQLQQHADILISDDPTAILNATR